MDQATTSSLVTVEFPLSNWRDELQFKPTCRHETISCKLVFQAKPCRIQLLHDRSDGFERPLTSVSLASVGQFHAWFQLRENTRQGVEQYVSGRQQSLRNQQQDIETRRPEIPDQVGESFESKYCGSVNRR